MEEEEERESQRTDVQTYSEGTFKGNGFGIEKNSKCEVTGNLSTSSRSLSVTNTQKRSLNVKERLLTSNTQTGRPFPVQDRKLNRSRRQKRPKKKTPCFSCFTEHITPEHHHYCPFVYSVHCGSCNFVLSHSSPPHHHQSPNKTMPVFVQPRLCVWPSSHVHTRSRRVKFFTKPVGCYDYKLASVLIRFLGYKRRNFYFVSLRRTKGVGGGGVCFYFAGSLKAALNDL